MFKSRVEFDENDMLLISCQIATLLLFAPIPNFFYSDSRKWLAQSLWRLVLAGIYPVEFRDFFLGDMFCSQTYAMGNIELFFCLYARGWRDPPQCNSGHSRLLGFFSALPGVWRAAQCLRRYGDTRNWYPHIANMGKYGFTYVRIGCEFLNGHPLTYRCCVSIAQYATLSLWRLHESSYELKALFIAMAATNSIYCILWDIFNDWSISPIRLRTILAYRKHKWFYYAAVVEDIVLRFLWLGYVIFPRDYQVQHSSIISFVIAILEVLRRGVWVCRLFSPLIADTAGQVTTLTTLLFR
jgi:xenotropic and polytropic retrovirus receptor 1